MGFSLLSEPGDPQVVLADVSHRLRAEASSVIDKDQSMLPGGSRLAP
jgi:hypothetical protein